MFYLSTDWKIVSVSLCRNFLNVGNFPLSVGGLIHSWWTMAIFANKTKQNKTKQTPTSNLKHTEKCKSGNPKLHAMKQSDSDVYV